MISTPSIVTPKSTVTLGDDWLGTRGRCRHRLSRVPSVDRFTGSVDHDTGAGSGVGAGIASIFLASALAVLCASAIALWLVNENSLNPPMKGI
jgi:hypothetical protein